MEDNFNKHLGNKLKLRRLALGLTQTKVAKAINVTFQQIQKYEKGTNGVSSIRLLQLSNYLKVPINYFFEDFSEYLVNLEKSKEGHMNINYNFLVKVYSELTQDQKIKFGKNLQLSQINIKNYLRIICLDSPGVIGKIGDIFGKNNVSIESIVQLDASEDKAEIVVITHEVNNGDFEKSKDEINSLNEVKIIASQLSCI